MENPSTSWQDFDLCSPSSLRPSHCTALGLQDDGSDDLDIDIDLFQSIMKEDPDPGKLIGHIDTDEIQAGASLASYVTQSPDQVSHPIQQREQLLDRVHQDCKLQAWGLPETKGNVFVANKLNEEEMAAQTAESSQSDAFSQPSELSWDNDDRFRTEDGSQSPLAVNCRLPGERSTEYTDGFRATNMLEHEKWPLKSKQSSLSTALPRHAQSDCGDKVLVDLIDTDSDCEGELNWGQGEINGKRKLPGWVEPRQQSSKDIHARPPPRKEAHNDLDSKPMKTQAFHGTQANSSYNSSSALSLFGPRPGVTYPKVNVSDPMHLSTACTGAMPGVAYSKVNISDPMLLSTSCPGGAQARRGNGISGSVASANSNTAFEDAYCTSGSSDIGSRGVLPSTLAPQIVPAKEYGSGHTREFPSRGLLKVLDDMEYREESGPGEGLMAVQLLKHQRVALAWMEKKERGAECCGGILADDQGLGKTVSTIALILKAKPPVPNSFLERLKQVSWEASAVDLDDEEDVQGNKMLEEFGGNYPSDKQVLQEKTVVVSQRRPSAGTLVVCPTSVVRQWAQEIKEKVTEAAALSVLLYHGSNRTKDPSELAKHDIVLTTYSIVSMEVPKQPLPDEKEADERNPSHYGLTFSGNSEKKLKTLENAKKRLKGKKGNSDAVDDLYIGPLAKVAWFRVVLDEAQNIKNRRTQVARACWGLRAKRRWCLSGTPIQNAIDDLYSYFRFLKYDPFSAYKSFRSQIKDPIARDPSNGYRNLQAVLQKVMLRRTKTTTINGEPIITLPKKSVNLEQVEFSSAERAFYSNLEVQSRKQFQMYAAAGTVQNNYVNILWMLLRLRQACDHPLLVKGHHSDAAQRSTMESASRLSDEKRTILLSVLERNHDTCCICMDAPEDAVITLCAHVFCRQCISEKLIHDDCISCPHSKCHATLNPSAVFPWSVLRYPGSGVEPVVEPSVDTLTENIVKDHSESSSKIKAVIKTLRALPVVEGSKKADSIKEEASMDGFDNNFSCLDPEEVMTEKAIVFSQWTSMLNLLEVSLKQEGFGYRRLDGTMSIQARDRALSDFKLSPKVTVMIMSLKAASLGLNMVAASHVLLIDVWWNPTTEDQAVDRAHRIGQTREVHVSRFTVKNTIEDRILALQDRKRQMVASAFGEDAGTDQRTRLTMDEMRYLFRM